MSIATPQGLLEGFSQITSQRSSLCGPSRTEFIYALPDELSKLTSSDQGSSNILLPRLSEPLIESALFKAYLVLAEDNIFLQNESSLGNRASRRSQRRGVLSGEEGVEENQDTEDADQPEYVLHEQHDVSETRDSTSDTDSIEEEASSLPPAVLRGVLVLRVTRPNTKIKAISLNFRGDSRTNWPEGIPPKKTEFVELQNVLNHEWRFFNSLDRTMKNYNKGGADHVNSLSDTLKDEDVEKLDLNDGFLSAVTLNSLIRTVRKSRFFKGKNGVFSRKHQDSEESSGTNTSSEYTFGPGDYIYSFEYAFPQSSPESVTLTFGFVTYWLNLEISRPGKFKSALRAKKKVNLIRTNTAQSIEENMDPILINKLWEDRLTYSILIASNLVVLDSFMPVHIRLVPTDKNVKLYKIKIFIVEILEYWCKDRKVHRLEPQRKFLLLEHKPKYGTNLLRDSQVSDLENSVISDKNSQGHHLCPRSHLTDSLHTQVLLPQGKKSLTKPSSPAEDDEDEYISSKDFTYQLYVPEAFAKFTSKLHPDAKHKNIQCHHWIKISLRLSKTKDEFDVEPPLPGDSNNSDSSLGHAPAPSTGFGGGGAAAGGSQSYLASGPQKGKRKHYEILIDLPITLLHPLCTQANTLLPEYDNFGFNPNVAAKRTQQGDVQLVTPSGPLFPPEAFEITSKETHVVGGNAQALKTDVVAAHRSPAIFVPNSGQDELDNELEATASNLYRPGAVDLDLAAAQAQPMVRSQPGSPSLLPNFQALQHVVGTGSLTSPLLVATSAPSMHETLLVMKPPVKPPPYEDRDKDLGMDLDLPPVYDEGIRMEGQDLTDFDDLAQEIPQITLNNPKEEGNSSFKNRFKLLSPKMSDLTSSRSSFSPISPKSQKLPLSLKSPLSMSSEFSEASPSFVTAKSHVDEPGSKLPFKTGDFASFFDRQRTSREDQRDEEQNDLGVI